VIGIFALLAIGGLMQAAQTFAPGVTQPGGTELAFGFLLLAAYFTGKTFNKVGLPKLTGYIAAGIITGPAVLGLVQKDMVLSLKLVGGVATAILALEAGAELNIKTVRPLFRVVRRVTLFAVFGGILILAGTLIAIRPLVPFLNALPFSHALVVASSLGVALAAQSPAVVMALIGETRADGILTRTILTLVIVADLAIITSYGIASSVANAVIAGQIDLGGAIGGIAWEVFGSMGVGLFIGFVLGVFVIYVGKGMGLFTVMMCFVLAEIGHAVHLDPLIIALTAGIWLENVSRANARELMKAFEKASLPVYLVFFALAGAKLDLSALWVLKWPVAIIVLTRGTTFFLGCRVATAIKDVDPQVRRKVWIGLLPQAGLALALAELVRRSFPAFGNEAFALVVGVVATNELLAPVILRFAFLRSGEAGRREASDTGGH
jgi:Kef-type K+ transport system membrane component KefB